MSTELHDDVRTLLMHDFPVEIVTTDDGRYAVALLLDGWYADQSNEYGLDVEGVLPFWQEIVDQIRETLNAQAAQC